MAQGRRKPNYYHIGSLEKGIRILETLAEGGTMPLADIAARGEDGSKRVPSISAHVP